MSSFPTYLLAGGVELIQASELPDEVRKQLGAGPDAVAVALTIAGARLVSAVAGRLLEHFKEPTTIAQAVLVFADQEGRDREELLTAVWPMLRALAECGFLRLEGDAEHDANPKLLLAPGTNPFPRAARLGSPARSSRRAGGERSAVAVGLGEPGHLDGGLV